MAKKANKVIKAKPKEIDAKAAGAALKTGAAPDQPGPWLKLKTGVYVIAAASILMAVLTAWESIPYVGWLDGILYGLLFGALIWVVFYFSQLFFRWLRQ